ncbi:SPOR domain-containing protein [Plebeiibacterium marinum]|uniref:SPOR domain-containing protein n=1 Tax=Plebeiibacterium marinum TaxID=2992111 RepID=A0AAE3SK02_9BACT|nr:SPOR domain-containing protein [Plebeiobacterium marinum]MCW3806107.1 SPOR domain-containing protein [Plebeiobacterium marinum]
MLNLEKHIKELLYKYDCVIVPNLGGFVANNINADFNEKTGVFTPPSREIGFNRNLSHNDGLLINHIALCEGMPYSEVQDRLLKHISILKYQLSRGEQLLIEGVGNLKYDHQGLPYFIPTNKDSFSTDCFGLSTFHFNTLEQEKEQNDRSRRLVRRTLESKSIRQIAASVALILGLVFISPEIEKAPQYGSFSDMIPTIETLENGNNTETQEASSNEITVSEETTEVKTAEPEPAPENKYFIIAGSFKDKNPASSFVRKLNNKGIETAQILSSTNGRYRVSLEGFINKQEATIALKNYRKTHGYSSAWLLTQN